MTRGRFSIGGTDAAFAGALFAVIMLPCLLVVLLFVSLCFGPHGVLFVLALYLLVAVFSYLCIPELKNSPQAASLWHFYLFSILLRL